jgi:membrane protein
MGKIIDLIKTSFKEFGEDKAARLAAALSYYTVFSLAPILVIAIAVAGFFFGQQATQDRIVAQISGLVGEDGAMMIQEMIASTGSAGDNIFASIVGILLLLFGATGLFGQLQEALNTIWEVQPKKQGIWGVIKDRFFSFTVLLGVAFVLLVSLVVSAGLSAFGGYINSLVPGLEILVMIVNFIVSFLVITILFSLMFKILPDARIRWKDVLPGGAVTAFLFMIGQILIGIYLGRGSATSAFGAAGSLVLILLWVYYSGMILFFGAEFTQTYARMFGKGIQPERGATLMTEEQRSKQGIPHRDQPTGEIRSMQTQAPLPATGGTQGAVTYSSGTSTNQLKHFDDEYRIQGKQPLKPADKSMFALGGILASLAAYTGAIIFRKKQK